MQAMSTELDDIGAAGKREAAKLRTRKKLLEAVRELTAEGADLSIATAARRAGIGVATAYRYYSDLDSLRRDAALDLRLDEERALFLEEYRRRIAAVGDPEERLVIAQRQIFDQVGQEELDYRMFIAKAQESHVRARARHETPVPRGGRRLAMIETALEPVRRDWSDSAYRALVLSLILVFGPEPWLTLRDYGRAEASSAAEAGESALRDLYRAHLARRDGGA